MGITNLSFGFSSARFLQVLKLKLLINCKKKDANFLLNYSTFYAKKCIFPL